MALPDTAGALRTYVISQSITNAGTSVTWDSDEIDSVAISSLATFFVSNAGGPPASLFKPSHNLREAVVTVICRGSPRDSVEPLTRARAIMLACHRATISEYVSVLVRESDPNRFGMDTNQCYRFGFNVVLQWHQTS